MTGQLHRKQAARMAVLCHWHIRYKWFGDYTTIIFNYIFHHYFSCWLITGPSHQCTVFCLVYISEMLNFAFYVELD